jgi:DNA polymerase-3 subunit delta'
MLFSEILGQEHIKSHLSADLGRIPHAQLFIGPKEVALYQWLLPMQYIICNNQNAENDSLTLLATLNSKNSTS